MIDVITCLGMWVTCSNNYTAFILSLFYLYLALPCTSLNTGLHWRLIPRQWRLINRQWRLILRQWRLILRQWRLIPRHWRLIPRKWRLIPRQWRLIPLKFIYFMPALLLSIFSLYVLALILSDVSFSFTSLSIPFFHHSCLSSLFIYPYI